MVVKTLPIVLLSMAMGSGAALAKPAYSMADVTACSHDAMHFCRDHMPDLDAIESCMRANYDRLRPACRARFDRK